VRRGGLAALLLVLSLFACAPKPAPISNPDTLESGIDKQMGGVGTCVVLADAKTGAILYQYNSDAVCKTPLPPCSTFNIVTSLIGLDSGVIAPGTVFKWDGTPQPVKALQTDADIRTAYKNAIDWWFQRLATEIGHDRYAQALSAFDYGNKALAGPLPMFWDGPHVGGGLGISTRQQADFLSRLYAGKLPVKADTASIVESLMVNETRSTPGAPGSYVMSGETGSCASAADGSTTVGWWVGRLKTPKRDLVFAASVNGATAPPGEEVEEAMKDILADAGLWPQG
jgi:beta-lactamase class D